RREESLRKDAERYRALLDQAHHVNFFWTDPPGRIIDITPSVQNMLGYAREELVGSQARDLYAVRAERQLFVDELLRNGRVDNFLMQLRDKSGNIKHGSVTAWL